MYWELIFRLDVVVLDLGQYEWASDRVVSPDICFDVRDHACIHVDRLAPERRFDFER